MITHRVTVSGHRGDGRQFTEMHSVILTAVQNAEHEMPGFMCTGVRLLHRTYSRAPWNEKHIEWRFIFEADMERHPETVEEFAMLA